MPIGRAHLRCVIVFLVMFVICLSSPAGNTAEKKITLDEIIQGAKKEGKVSWASNLVDDEVVELNKAFQKEFPFIKKVEYGRLRGSEENERLISEMQAGVFPFDLISIEEELIPRFQQLGLFNDPLDWNSLFGVDSRMIHPNRFGVAVGNTSIGVTYNKSKVPREKIPKAWTDCLDPFFKGRLALEIRGQHFISLMAGKGEEWTYDFAKKLAANKPKWTSSATAAITMVAAGETLIVCPTSHGSWYRQASRKPNYPVGWVFPEGPIMASRGLLLSPIKGGANPNAATLLAGWTASKGLPILDTGRESIFHPGTKLGAEFKRMGREIKVQDWELMKRSDERLRKLVETWGFPKAEK